jgi:capsular polysaccharide biosynthesis protein
MTDSEPGRAAGTGTAGSPTWLPSRPRRLLVSALVGVIVAALAAAMVLRGDEVHQSRALVVIDQPVALATGADGGLLDKLSRLRIKYADLVPTAEISGEAADSLGLPIGRVAGAVSAEVPQLSLTIAITARSGDPAESVEIANAVADALVDYADAELADVGVKPADRYEFRVVVPASSARKVDPTTGEALKAAISFGLLTLGAAYVLFELLDATAGRRRHAD